MFLNDAWKLSQRRKRLLWYHFPSLSSFCGMWAGRGTEQRDGGVGGTDGNSDRWMEGAADAAWWRGVDVMTSDVIYQLDGVFQESGSTATKSFCVTDLRKGEWNNKHSLLAHFLLSRFLSLSLLSGPYLHWAEQTCPSAAPDLRSSSLTVGVKPPGLLAGRSCFHPSRLAISFNELWSKGESSEWSHLSLEEENKGE